MTAVVVAPSEALLGMILVSAAAGETVPMAVKFPKVVLVDQSNDPLEGPLVIAPKRDDPMIPARTCRKARGFGPTSVAVKVRFTVGEPGTTTTVSVRFAPVPSHAIAYP